MLSNAYFLAKFRFDTAENEPAKICKIFEKCIFENAFFECAFSKNAFSKNAFSKNAFSKNAFSKNLRREARRAGPQVCGREADLGPALLRPERARRA